jgi:divalent metal cation (Fe/Co/Zn/Cd) transporter
MLNIAIEHDPRIMYIDTLTCYHSGENLIVELHVVLAPDMPLRVSARRRARAHSQDSHDITEKLQRKLMMLPNVECVFVHSDYKCDALEEKRFETAL